MHFLKVTCYWISRIGPNVFHVYWHNIHFKGRCFTNRWIVDCSWKPEQEVKWYLAPGREPQSVHSVNPSFSSAHDRTPGSDELQRDKRTNGWQTLGAICTNAERSHETQLLDFASILQWEKISSQYFILDAGAILRMFVSCNEVFGGQSALTKRCAGGSLLNPPCVIRTLEFHPGCLWLLWTLCTFHHCWHGRQRLRN